MEYMKVLVTADDVREVNKETFHLETFFDDFTQEFIEPKQAANRRAGARPRK
jgi:hypothetical protein